MQLSGQILTGSTQTIATKKGDHLQKTRLKVLDLGPEANGGDVYWIDFLGDAALTDEELRQVSRQQVMSRCDGCTPRRARLVGRSSMLRVARSFSTARSCRRHCAPLRQRRSFGVHWGRSLAEWSIPAHDKDVFGWHERRTLNQGYCASGSLL